MSGHLDVLLGVALALLVVMVATWLISLPLRNVGVADVVWGLGFVVAVWVARGIGDGNVARGNLLTAMVTIWGLRLSAHLWWRNRAEEERVRYRSIRTRHGDSFPAISLVTVFGLQGVIMFVVALPVLLAATPTTPDVGWLAVVGVSVWGMGLFFEAVGDAQLARFRAEAADAGSVMDRGLWRYTRHPNYFGDFCVWWGVFLVAAEVGDARIGIVGPLVMTTLLTRVSGIPALERRLMKRHEGYGDYVAHTSSFFPRPPHPRSSDVH